MHTTQISPDMRDDGHLIGLISTLYVATYHHQFCASNSTPKDDEREGKNRQELIGLRTFCTWYLLSICHICKRSQSRDFLRKNRLPCETDRSIDRDRLHLKSEPESWRGMQIVFEYVTTTHQTIKQLESHMALSYKQNTTPHCCLEPRALRVE